MFGWDHCETGRRLISDWKLPGDFDAIVLEHHSAKREDGAWEMGELVKTSCRMADAAGFPAFPGCETTPYAELLEDVPARERRLFYPTLEALAQEVANDIRAVESV